MPTLTLAQIFAADDDNSKLGYGAVSAQPISYEFTWTSHADYAPEHREQAAGNTWRVCEGTLIPDGTCTSITLDGVEIEFDLDTYDIIVSDLRLDEEGDVRLHPSDDEYEHRLDQVAPTLDVDDIRAAAAGEDTERWEPAMNYAYPLPCAPPDDWKTRVNNCTCVQIGDEYYLALTGGGMDLSWEICASYVALGHYPPAHFARLPTMAGRGKSTADRALLVACRRSLAVVVERAIMALSYFDNDFPAIEPEPAPKAAKKPAKKKQASKKRGSKKAKR